MTTDNLVGNSAIWTLCIANIQIIRERGNKIHNNYFHDIGKVQ